MATITQDVTLIFDADNNLTRVQDNTVWPTNGDLTYNTLLGMKGVGSLANPSGGLVFNATSPSAPLIDLSDGDTTSINYNLPTSSGAIVNGTYAFSYSAVGSYDASPTPIEVVSSTGFITLDDENIAAIVLQAGDSVVISGNSSNPAANGTWTVVSVESVGTFSKIYLQGFNITDATPDGLVDFAVSRTITTSFSRAYTGCTKVTPKITFTSQPYTGEFGTLIVSDSTDYSGVTLTDQTITVAYPDGLVPAPTVNPIVGTDVSSVTISEVATGTYTITLDGVIQDEISTGFVVEYTTALIRVKGKPVNVFERVVVWRDGLCCLYSCIEKLSEKHNRFVMNGQESPFTAAVADLSLAVDMYLVAVQCGEQDKIESSFALVQSILESTECECGCSESNGPVWISNSSQEGENLITTLQDEIDALTASVNALSTNVETLGNSVNDLANDVTSLSSTVTTLSDNVSTLTTDVSDLTTEVNSKVASVTGVLVNNTDPQNPVVSLELNEDQFSGTGATGNPLNIIGVDASVVIINPAISGLTATDGQSAFAELQTSKLETVVTDGTTITGNGTSGSPLAAHSSSSGPYVFSAILKMDLSNPTSSDWSIISNNIPNGVARGINSASDFSVFRIDNVWTSGKTNVSVSVGTLVPNSGSLIPVNCYINNYGEGDSAIEFRLLYCNTVTAQWSFNPPSLVSLSSPIFNVFIKIEMYP
jgi:uncharacterized protein YoxC